MVVGAGIADLTLALRLSQNASSGALYCLKKRVKNPRTTQRPLELWWRLWAVVVSLIEDAKLLLKSILVAVVSVKSLMRRLAEVCVILYLRYYSRRR